MTKCHVEVRPLCDPTRTYKLGVVLNAYENGPEKTLGVVLAIGDSLAFVDAKELLKAAKALHCAIYGTETV